MKTKFDQYFEEQKRKMLAYASKDDWDGEGCRKISLELLDKVYTFLKTHEDVWQLNEIQPTLSAGDASIDVHWKTNTFEALMNIKEEQDFATIYGDDWPQHHQFDKINIKIEQQRLMLNKTYPNLFRVFKP